MKNFIKALLFIKEVIVAIGRFLRKKELDEAAKKAEIEGDQTDVEEAISGDSGNPTKHEYSGLRVRPSKKRGDMAD